MVEPLSGLGEGEMAEVVWIISEADVREMLGRSGFLYGEVPVSYTHLTLPTT